MKEIRVKRDGLENQLKKIRIFRHLNAASIQTLIDRAVFLRAESGECIIEEGTTDDRLFVIIEKSVTVTVRENDKDVYICTLGAGDVVGEAAVFTDFRRTATVSANDEMTLLSISREAFITTLRENPQAGLRILFTMVHSLLSKLREVNLELAFERRDQSDQEEVDDLIDSLLGEVGK